MTTGTFFMLWGTLCLGFMLGAIWCGMFRP